MLCQIEACEQAIEALCNEQPSEEEFEKLKSELNQLRFQAKLVETERNTLADVIRILASKGVVNPVEEGKIVHGARESEDHS